MDVSVFQPHCGTPSRNINNYGVSIVALLDNGKFNNQLLEHCESIKELNYRFTKIMNLHSTLLGIFDGNVRTSNAKI